MALTAAFGVVTLTAERPLTARESTYLRLRAEGLTNRQVAHAMAITPHTAKQYQRQIAWKVLGSPGNVFDILHELGWIRVPEEMR